MAEGAGARLRCHSLGTGRRDSLVFEKKGVASSQEQMWGMGRSMWGAVVTCESSSFLYTFVISAVTVAFSLLFPPNGSYFDPSSWPFVPPVPPGQPWGERRSQRSGNVIWSSGKEGNWGAPFLNHGTAQRSEGKSLAPSGNLLPMVSPGYRGHGEGTRGGLR